MSTSRQVDQEALVAAVLAELGGPEREAIDRWSELTAAERQRLEREDLELVGLLPQALVALPPGAASREALLAAVERAQAAPWPPVLAARREPAGTPRWLLPLAAGLAVAALGLAGFLLARLESQRSQLARLEAEVVTLRSQTAALAARERETRSQLALVASPGVEVCALRPRRAAAGERRPFGVLYLAADHQHWYLALHDLEALPEGSVYQLWFDSADGPVSAGTFRPEPGAPVELSSETMPGGTWATRVTIEVAGGAQRPSGREVLYGDQLMKIS